MLRESFVTLIQHLQNTISILVAEIRRKDIELQNLRQEVAELKQYLTILRDSRGRDITSPILLERHISLHGGIKNYRKQQDKYLLALRRAGRDRPKLD